MADEKREPTPGMRGFGPFSVIAAIGSVCFAVALLNADVTLGFVRIIAFGVFVIAVFDAILMAREHRRLLAGGFALIAVVTNPFLAFAASSAIWVVVFLVIALYFAIVAFFVRGPGPDPDADVTPDKRFL